VDGSDVDQRKTAVLAYKPRKPFAARFCEGSAAERTAVGNDVTISKLIGQGLEEHVVAPANPVKFLSQLQSLPIDGTG
jgi:hypothetical protein